MLATEHLQSPSRFGDDFLCHHYIPERMRVFDLELFRTKWWDYRFLTAAAATRLYVDAYARVYREIYAREMDYVAAQHIQPWSWPKLQQALMSEKPTAKRLFSSFWKGRQCADAIGMPYEDYVEWMMTFRMRAWKRPHLPHPQHLYHPIDLERTTDRWENHIQTERLLTSEHPAYFNAAYIGTDEQNAYHEWLFKQAFGRANPYYVLSRFLSEERIPAAKVQARLGDDFERVTRELSNPANALL